MSEQTHDDQQDYIASLEQQLAAETARADRAEADNAALIEATRNMLHKFRFATSDSKVQEAVQNLDRVSQQSYSGARFLELAQIVKECESCTKKLNEAN